MIRFAYSFTGQHREGEFAFLCSNQKHWSTSEKSVRKQAEVEITDQMEAYGIDDRQEVMEEFGELKIYKLVVTEVK